MGDVAFLLIIFFMVCSRFAKDPGQKIDPPTTIDVAKLEDYPIVVVLAADGRIFLQGSKVEGAEAVESGVRQLLEGNTSEKKKTVIFRCDRTVGKNTFEPVLEAIAKGGGRIAAVGIKSSP